MTARGLVTGADLRQAIERAVRREAGLPGDPNWYAKLTYAHLPRPNTPWPCPRWVDPRWWAKAWGRKPANLDNEQWRDRLCNTFNKIDRRGQHG
jgi:hypothetical protein